MGEMHKGRLLPRSLGIIFPKSQHVHQPRSPPTLSLLFFMEASLCRPDWLHQWPLWTDLIPVPLPFPEVRGWDWKFQPSITWLVLRQPAWGASQKSHHEHNEDWIWFSHLGNQDFRSSLPEMRHTTKYIFLILHHNIVPSQPKHWKCDWRSLQSSIFNF